MKLPDAYAGAPVMANAMTVATIAMPARQCCHILLFSSLPHKPHYEVLAAHSHSRWHTHGYGWGLREGDFGMEHWGEISVTKRHLARSSFPAKWRCSLLYCQITVKTSFHAE